MSQDEVFLLIGSAAGVLFGVVPWYAPLRLPLAPRHVRYLTGPLALAPMVSVGLIYIALRTLAAYDVREAPEYLVLYALLGCCWFFGAVKALEWVGISFADDAVERHNAAATIAVIAAMLAHSAIYAGANVGDGPGWWCVVIAASVGSLAWFLLWGAVEAACGAAEELTVERDTGAALRLGGYMIASGLVCARGSAGDWTSLGQTLLEFHVAWPAVVLAAAAVAVERVLRGHPPTRRSRLAGASIGLAYLAAALLALQMAPPLPQNPAYDHAQSGQ
ncbi:MAG TPA: hypothetical protein VM074_01840 [Solimonas sp.]|nr:hypothetical protein [Solimonas sp.]